MRTKAWCGAAVAAGAFLLAGCVVEPEDDGGYGEIRVDAFAHFWESNKLWADSHGVVDTLVLTSSTFDNTSQLPEHFLDSVGLSTQVIYAVTQEPLEFSCYYDNGGKDLHGTSSVAPNWVLRQSEVPYVEGYPSEQETWRRWLVREDVSATIAPMPCGYLKGKGFYFGYPGYDIYGEDPRAPGGTFIIRYRY